jgi:putative beta-barrel porin BBP2
MLRRTVLLGCLALAQAIPAGAQSSPGSDPDASTTHLGPIGITPTFLVRAIGRDENVYNDAVNPVSDYTFTVVPGAKMLFKPAFMRVEYTTATEYVYYRQQKSERSTNSSSAVRVQFNLARVQPYVMYSGVSSKERLNTEIDKRARHNERVYGGGLGFKVGSRFLLGTGVKSTRLAFDRGIDFRGEELAHALNSDVRSIDASGSLELTPFTTFTLGVSREQQRFVDAHDRDSDSWRVMPTVSFSAQAVLTGGISFGYRHFKPRSPLLPVYSGLVATVTANTTVWNRYRLEMNFARDLRNSYQADTPYYLATGGTLTVTVALVGPFDVQVNGTRQILAYRGKLATATEKPGDDTVTGYGGGFGYRPIERLRIGINATWAQRDSQLASNREYHNRRIFAALTWGTGGA